MSGHPQAARAPPAPAPEPASASAPAQLVSFRGPVGKVGHPPAPPPLFGDAEAGEPALGFADDTATLSARAPSLDDDDDDGDDDEKQKQRPSTTTLAPPPLPDGCSYGVLENGAGGVPERVIWVEFPPGSPDNPFFFSTTRKVGITIVASVFTFLSAYTTTAYSISEESMCRELHCSNLQFATGIALYAWGFGIFPLSLAPVSEEFGRRWTYVLAAFLFWILHLQMTFAKNFATVLVNRFLLGAAGSVGSTLVGGTISDIFVPAQRGLPMALFGFCAVFATGFGSVTMAFVETVPRLGWRWVQWIQFIVMGALLPAILLILRETRATVILRRRAKKLRAERGMQDGARYLAHSDVDKVKFTDALLQSVGRPLLFLVTEPTVAFFSLWVALGWGVLYIQIAGLPYLYRRLHGFDTRQIGLCYLAVCLGALLGFGANFIQEAVYRRRAPVRGVEARLYAPMVAGVALAVGCFIMGFTALPNVHWIAPLIGIVVIIAGILTIYITAFTYLSECYGIYASSALAGQSFARNMFGGAFSMFTTKMFDAMTVRWALVMNGGIATLLAIIPFVAFFWGPAIRARSKYSRMLMQLERDTLEKERRARVARGISLGDDMEDLEGDANDLDEDGHRANLGHVHGGRKV